jgi:hypothetical protein
MQKGTAAAGNENRQQEEQRRGVQPIGNVLDELFSQYRIRLPHLNRDGVFPQRPSPTWQR